MRPKRWSFFEQTLGALPDPRRRQGLRVPLQTVVVTALMAMVCGCDDAEAMGLWGKANGEWLSKFVPLPHGAPTQDVFVSVFAALACIGHRNAGGSRRDSDSQEIS